MTDRLYSQHLLAENTDETAELGVVTAAGIEDDREMACDDDVDLSPKSKSMALVFRPAGNDSERSLPLAAITKQRSIVSTLPGA